MRENSIALTYDKKYLQYERPQPLTDNKIESLIQEVVSKNINPDTTNQIYEDFKIELINWITSSKLNSITGFNSFNRTDICIGCTQFIDTVYMNGPVQTIEGDYKYHERLNDAIQFSIIGNLKPKIPLIIALPFPQIGDIHASMDLILDECLSKDIPVHIDGAWITCCRNINFNLNHPSIKSAAISLSKGLGLGWNRIGLRWSKHKPPDAITVMNDFHMNNRALVIIGLYFLRNLQSDHLWTTHKDRYEKICKDFSLEQTNSIYIALKDKNPVGISPLIRYLENNG
jgi:hypothetical protein